MIFPSDPLEQVREGMAVLDQHGGRLGTVRRVQAAPVPVTHPPDSDLLDEMATFVPSPPDMDDVAGFQAPGASPWGHDPSGLPDLPEPLREHLERHGFLELDLVRGLEGGQVTAADKFVPSDRIVSVGPEGVVVRIETDTR